MYATVWQYQQNCIIFPLLLLIFAQEHNSGASIQVMTPPRPIHFTWRGMYYKAMKQFGISYTIQAKHKNFYWIKKTCL